jgi:hypothetical protein
MNVEEIKKALRAAGWPGSDEELDHVARKIHERSDGEPEPRAIEAAVSAYDAAESGMAANAPGASVMPLAETAISAFEVAQRDEQRRRTTIESQESAVTDVQREDIEARADAGAIEDADEEMSAVGRRNLLEALSQLLQRPADETDLAEAKSAVADRLGLSSITDATLLGRIQAGDPFIVQALGDEESIVANEMMAFTDSRTGETQYVSRAVYDTVLKGLAGAADYTVLANRTFADSVRRGFSQENWYGLLAYSHGLTDPNETFEEPLDTGELPTALGAQRDELSLRRQFLRGREGIPKSRPKRYIMKTPFNRKGVENPAYKRWATPEQYVSDEQWQGMRQEYEGWLAARRSDEDSDRDMVDETFRLINYDRVKPQYEANLNSGMGPLIALLATHDKGLADRARTGQLSIEDRQRIANDILRGADPEQMGMISDSIEYYDALAKSRAPSGGGRTIVQPNRDKIREGFLELYRSWFQQDPAEGELEGLITEVANEFVSAQHQNRESDVQSTALAAVRATDLYSQLYGQKPTGLTEDQYIGQFQRVGQNLLGGQMPSSQAVQAGMRGNNPNVTTSMVAQDQASWQNSSWLERVYQIAELANRLT